MNIAEIKKDIVSFADDEDDVIIENDGTILFSRSGELIEFKIEIDPETYACNVLYNGNTIPYKQFLSNKIANLEALALKLKNKRNNVDIFIDSNSKLYNNSNIKEGTGLELLKMECENPLLFCTKMTFITADAGHGKTVLLQEYQRIQAERFLLKESNFIFWHIDLQGRDLVRLNEAIVYDLGELRLVGRGLYFSSILTLIKHDLLILAIDGFDELAAEIGGSTALGALASLVSSLEGRGTIIAASRRAFFNTQDYAKRTKMLQGRISSTCEFHELRIANWEKKENIDYLSFYFDKVEDIYSDMLEELHDPQHPILARPYLFSKITNLAYASKSFPNKILSGIDNKKEGINIVVEAFLRREVIKWKERDKETGKPYLTFEQHIQLLSSIAYELWENQSDSISLNNIHLLLSMLFDEWQIEERLKPLINRMVESHALLIPDQINDNCRRFEHLEFKNYFIAKNLKSLITSAIEKGAVSPLKRFLYISQMQDSIALYLTNEINGNDPIVIINVLQAILKDEWKPTFLQTNIGTMIPYLLDGKIFKDKLIIDQKVNFSSLIFEGKTLSNIHFQESNFLNISFKNTSLSNITFQKCYFTELRILFESNNIFSNVSIIDSEVNNIVMQNKEGVRYPEYSPSSINSILRSLHFSIKNLEPEIEFEPKEDSQFKKSVKHFLAKFNSATYIFENSIENEPFYVREKDLILGKIIPILSKHNIIEKRETKNAKQASTIAWRLVEPDISLIFKGEDDKNSKYYMFWQEI
jgi:hypothetical protein